MKKHFWLLLVASLLAVLFLAGCGNGGDPTDKPAETTAGNETTAANPDDPYAGQFRVGHGRVNITPKDSVPLAGYGNTEFRLSTGFLDYVYATCIAITDENDETMLIYAIDIIKANTKVTGDLREVVSAATGIPVDHILLNTTHTHSMIDQEQSGMKVVQDWIKTYEENCVEAARLALADRLPAKKMCWTSVDLTGYNFVRHYLTDKGEGYSVNHTKYATGTPVKHTSTANPTMFLLKFEREGGKDIMFANWRCHNVLTSNFSGGGDAQKTNISSDWTGMVRTYIEKQYDVYYAYFMGDSGNIVASTSLPEEVEHHPPKDWKEYSREVVDLMIPAIDGEWEEIQTGPIQIVTETFKGKSNKAELDHLEEARLVYNYWREHNSGSDCIKQDPTHYIQSQYHAASIVGRPSAPEYREFLIAVGRIGDFAFTQAPFETFDTNGNFVRENSPTKYVFVMGYSNEHYGYLASQEAYDYGCYETDVATFERGVAEDLASRFVALLNQLYGK